MTKTLELLGEEPKLAQRAASVALSIETKLARASLTRVEERDPYKLKNRFAREKMVAFTPRFDWTAYWQASGAPAFKDLNVTQPRFFAAMNEALAKDGLAKWKAYFRWQLVNAYAPYLSSAFEGRRSIFTPFICGE